MSKKCAVVIPIYSEPSDLLIEERKLIDQVLNIFIERDVFLLLPNKLNGLFDSGNYYCIYAEDCFFKNKLTYSKLLCSRFFYSTFSEFEFIQIVQLDCWVFEDRLDEFMSMDFDYFGAPWMKNGFTGKPKKELWKVGNGGFSLRKVPTFLSIIEKIDQSEKGEKPVFRDLKNSIFNHFRKKGFRNNLRHYIKKPPGEDIFWTHYIPQVFSDNEFKIADTITGSNYSFEVYPRFLFEEVTNGKLPMGCHAWEYHDPSFWNKYIRDKS